MNALDPLHWTQNSCFGAFRTVSFLHESRCKTGRTGAINAQVRKTKYVGKFRNECIRSTPLDPKLMFWGVADRCVTARKSMQSWPN
jgi:hypothetical protein